MWRKRELAMVVGTLLFGFGRLSAQVTSQYQFSTAGNFPGSIYTVPLAASLTHIVGDYLLPAAGTHAYIQTGRTFLAAEPSGSASSYLSGINSHGVAVGGYCTTPGGCNPQAGEHGFAYNFHTRTTRTIDFPMGGAATVAYGINDTGMIVGGYCPNSLSCPEGLFNPASHGFVDDRGVFTTLDFPGAQATTASAINNAGSIVGYYLINNTGPHAFLYKNGTFTTIDFPGSGYTVATAINTLGAVAGLFANSTGLHGFIYFGGSFTQIDRPNATGTGVTGINDRNQLVGLWYSTVGFENFKAFPVAPAATGSIPLDSGN
jgi:probable HAF family extracellular repeat protein